MNKLKAYMQDTYTELQRISWPSRAETIRLTQYVIGVSLGIGLFVSLVDYIFKELLTYLLK